MFLVQADGTLYSASVWSMPWSAAEADMTRDIDDLSPEPGSGREELIVGSKDEAAERRPAPGRHPGARQHRGRWTVGTRLAGGMLLLFAASSFGPDLLSSGSPPAPAQTSPDEPPGVHRDDKPGIMWTGGEARAVGNIFVESPTRLIRLPALDLPRDLTEP